MESDASAALSGDDERPLLPRWVCVLVRWRIRLRDDQRLRWSSVTCSASRSAFGTVIRAGSTTAGVRKPVASFSRGQTGAIAPVGSGGPSGEMLADGTFDPSLYGRPSSSIVVE